MRRKSVELVLTLLFQGDDLMSIMIKTPDVFRIGHTTYVPLGRKVFAITDGNKRFFVESIPEDMPVSSPSNDDRGKIPTHVREIIAVVASIAIELDLQKVESGK